MMPPKPPPLPPDAFRRPGEAEMTPFDDQVIASAPKPVAAGATGRAAFKLPMWLRKYPVAHPDHIQELEQDSAVNEFGLRMPREKAEAEAYHKYQQRQHAEAAHHHLIGAALARKGGDEESARKHGMMYEHHVKALGHEPVGAVPPSVLHAGPSKLYRFKPHRGDIFVLNPVHAGEHGQVSSSPPPQLGKSEDMEKADLGFAVARCSHCHTNQKVDRATGKMVRHSKKDWDGWDQHCMGSYSKVGRPATERGSRYQHVNEPVQGGSPYRDLGPGTLDPHAGLGPRLGKAEQDLLAAIHMAAEVLAKAEYKCPECGESVKIIDGKVEGHIPKDKQNYPANIKVGQCKGAGSEVKKGEVVGKIGNPKGAEKQPKGRKQGYNDIQLAHARRFARNNGLPDALAGKLDEDGNKTKKSVNDWAKAELKARRGACRCEVYEFPHRHGGGKCKSNG